MAYTRTTWVDQEDPAHDPDVDPTICAATLNNIEQGIVDAHTHIASTDNPHSVTKDQVGLGNVTNDAQLKVSQLETSITDNDSMVPSSGAVVDYVAAHQGSGDMLKSTYDTDADGKVNAAVSADSVPWSGVSSKPATFPPESHTHGNISNAGAIGTTANIPIITGTGGILQAGSFGTGANTFCAGDDARLITNAKQADRPFVFQTGHTAWATGLSNEEIGRIQLQTGETLYIRRVELQIKGGGTSSSLSVNAYDSTNTTTIASQTAGGVNTTGGNSGAAALVLIRLTNSVGSTQSASVYISGWIRS